MDYLILIYFIYAAISVGLTAVLARTLSRNGAVFLESVFDTTSMADAVNQLLVIGFYMLNLGYAFLIFRTNSAATALEATEVLVTKLGLLLVSLGGIHLVNVLAFWKIRRRAEERKGIPVSPMTRVSPPPPVGNPVPAHGAV